jgi:hypothetical protein
VIVSECGDAKRQLAYFGDTMNVAARLCEQCKAADERLIASADLLRQAAVPRDLKVGEAVSLALRGRRRPIEGHAIERPGQERNMSGDAEQEYFVDGMVEDIITGLSRIKWLFVIARNSSFTYKGKAIDVRQVGRELGVRYVLEGGVRKAGNRLRITAQLLEAETVNAVLAAVGYNFRRLLKWLALLLLAILADVLARRPSKPINAAE